MRIKNVHERPLPMDEAAAAALLDSISSDDDRLWPARDWPAMRFDRPLAVGAKGGHGPIRYEVVKYEPGRRVVFAFDPRGPETRGFDGTHTFELIAERGRVRLRHAIDMETSLGAALRWYLVIEPLHDALVEDAFDRAEGVKRGKWSWRVRALRWWMKRSHTEPRERPAVTAR